MKKILITGGAGFIGSHTAVELIEAGYAPIILDDFSNAEPWIVDRIEKITGTRPTVYEGDCTDKTFVNQVFEKESFDGVIHFAAFKAVGESIEKPLEYYRNNIDSLLTILEAMKTFGVENIVFSSSATVYGVPESSPISEESQRKPATNPYGNTKSIAEDVLRDSVVAGEAFSSISLRYFNPIGAHPSGLIGELPQGVPNNLSPFITQTAAGLREAVIIFGDDYDTPDGTGVRDYIHVVDLAKAHVQALDFLFKKHAPFYDTFNVGTGQGNSVLELIKTFESVNKTTVPYEIGPRRSGDIDAFFADVQKIKTTIGWTAQYTIAEALRDAWRWQQQIN